VGSIDRSIGLDFAGNGCCIDFLLSLLTYYLLLLITLDYDWQSACGRRGLEGYSCLLTAPI
jgi:hypothetical protein